MKTHLRKIELLAPARDLQTAIAAVDWGADAVYMGANRFGARQAAGNPLDDIARAVEYARPYGVRVYATLNTLLFEDELTEAGEVARQLIAAGVDALIVQDMAYLEMGLRDSVAGGCPKVEFHASTQTFNASPEKVLFLQKAGFARVILERGLSLAQIRRIREATDVDLECFVHGAICVGYSGRCFFSRTMGARSGNRGDCSQPCRQTYDLVDESGKTLIENKHLLSVRDLDLSARLGDLLDAGVTSFKIEGRLKDAAYVKNIVAHYRRRLDEAMSRREGLVRASSGVTLTDFTPDPAKSFTRGRSEYFFDGRRAGVASFDTPKAIGEPVGIVTRTGNGWMETDGAKPLSPGDGICFDSGGELVGTNVNRVEGNRVFPNRWYEVAYGTPVFRNYDHSFAVALDRSRVRRVIDARAVVDVGNGILKLYLRDADGNIALVERQTDTALAENPEKMRETISAQMSKSGGTVFRVVDVEVNVFGQMPFIPVAEINSLRREGLERLLEARLAVPPVRYHVRTDNEYPYAKTSLDGSENVTNSLAETFYRRHGVKDIEPGWDLLAWQGGKDKNPEASTPREDYIPVLRTPYCIRRETGQCLLENPAYKGRLWLVHGRNRYRLDFDCAACEMTLCFKVTQ